MSSSEGGEGGGAGSGGIFVPKEELVTLLIEMGVTRNAAVKVILIYFSLGSHILLLFCNVYSITDYVHVYNYQT